MHSDALNTEAWAIAGVGGEWVGTQRRALEFALSEGIEEQVGIAFSNMCLNLVNERRFAEAERFYVDGLAYCHDHEIGTFATCLRANWTRALAMVGRWEESMSLSAELLTHTGASSVGRIYPQLNLGMVRIRRGDLPGWADLDKAMDLADGTGIPQWIAPARLARTEAHWLQADLSAARHEAELADDLSTRCDPWLRGEIAVWLRRTGSTRPCAGELAPPYQLQLDGASDKAAQAWIDLGCPYDAALAWLDSDQEEPLRKALSAFQHLGAPAAARITRQRMRELGIRSIPNGAQMATRAHPLGLTRREHEVLDLVCAGHTNGQIAARMFISVKTVEHHVSAMLAKLGVATRSAAVAQALRLGLVAAAGT